MKQERQIKKSVIVVSVLAILSSVAGLVFTLAEIDKKGIDIQTRNLQKAIEKLDKNVSAFSTGSLKEVFSNNEEASFEGDEEEVQTPEPSGNTTQTKKEEKKTTTGSDNNQPENSATLKTFKVTFNANGSDSIGSSELSCTTTGSSCSVTAPTIKRSGYTIVGWAPASDGSGSTVNVGGKITLVEDVTYYAITKEIQAAYNQSAAQSMLDMINAERMIAGSDNLSWSTSLEASAKTRAEEITRLFSHTRPDGSSCFTINASARGENIAAGYSTASATFNQWMESPGHKANMLNASFTVVGISAYYKPGSVYGTYWVQLFG